MRGMLEGGELAARDLLSGVNTAGGHAEVVGRLVRHARELGARGFMTEAEVYLGRGRGKSRIDLTFTWDGLKYGIEVDGRRPKWKSIEKLRRSGVDVGMVVLRHPRPDIDEAAWRFTSSPLKPCPVEIIAGPEGVLGLYQK